MPELQIDGQPLVYSLKLSRRRRSIAIMIDPERGVVVYAPHRVGERLLSDLLRQKSGWIKAKLERVKARAALPKAHFDGDLSDASKIIKERVAVHAGRMGLLPKKVGVKAHRRRWGSCSLRTGALYFNWRIVMAPLPVIDYIVVHELAHLEHPDHSRSFWSLVARFAPDHKAHRRWLREHGGRL